MNMDAIALCVGCIAGAAVAALALALIALARTVELAGGAVECAKLHCESAERGLELLALHTHHLDVYHAGEKGESHD